MSKQITISCPNHTYKFLKSKLLDVPLIKCMADIDKHGLPDQLTLEVDVYPLHWMFDELYKQEDDDIGKVVHHPDLAFFDYPELFETIAYHLEENIPFVELPDCLVKYVMMNIVSDYGSKGLIKMLEYMFENIDDHITDFIKKRMKLIHPSDIDDILKELSNMKDIMVVDNKYKYGKYRTRVEITKTSSGYEYMMYKIGEDFFYITANDNYWFWQTNQTSKHRFKKLDISIIHTTEMNEKNITMTAYDMSNSIIWTCKCLRSDQSPVVKEYFEGGYYQHNLKDNTTIQYIDGVAKIVDKSVMKYVDDAVDELKKLAIDV